MSVWVRFLIAVVASVMVTAAANAQLCALCQSRTAGATGSDDCAAWIVQWNSAQGGNCLQQVGTARCLASNNCLFDLTFSVLPTCPNPSFLSRLCLNFVDQNGLPIGSPLCGEPLVLPDPSGPVTINGLAVACGQSFTLEIYREGQPQPFLKISARCNGCPPTGG